MMTYSAYRKLVARRRRRDALGVTLIELIAFIVIIGVVAVAMVQAFSGTMRGSHFGKELNQGTQLAQQRMEVILGQRKTLGYTLFTTGDYDPCQSGSWTGQLCTSSTGFSVSSTRGAVDACGSGCTEVVVTVNGPSGGVASATYQAWNY